MARAMPSLPRAILFDLDDTIIRAYARPDEAWGRLLHRFEAPLGAAGDAAELQRLTQAMLTSGRDFWSDRARAAVWRLDIGGARRIVARQALQALGRPDDTLADRIADAFTAMRREEYRLYPDSHATLDQLRQAGVALALITNGHAETQRAKVVRFELEKRFDHIQIEGEFGKGKPEAEVYHHALGRLGVDARDTWMVGDNLEWEVEVPQRLGMVGIWFNPFEDGLPAGSTVVPDRIVARLSALLED
jgi:putative hydrolase of the HAD superfamily